MDSKQAGLWCFAGGLIDRFSTYYIVLVLSHFRPLLCSFDRIPCASRATDPDMVGRLESVNSSGILMSFMTNRRGIEVTNPGGTRFERTGKPCLTFASATPEMAPWRLLPHQLTLA